MSYGSRYVNEEQEYSESDCPSDAQMYHQLAAPDVTEIYRRKHLRNQALIRSSAGSYYHHPHPNQGYCDVPNRACGCNLEPRYCCYKPNPNNYEGGLNRNLPPPPQPQQQQQANLRMCHELKNTTVTTQPTKKYPVSAKTPRYYRNASAPLCKRPSTLCLPVACQPDPASAYRTCKPNDHRHHNLGNYYPLNDCCTTIKERPATAGATTTVHSNKTQQIDSEGDVNSRLNDLENLLTKFEQSNEEIDENEVEINTVTDLSKILKPKVPASIKAKQAAAGDKKSEKHEPVNATRRMSPRSKVEASSASASAVNRNEPLDALMRRFNRKDNVEKLKISGSESIAPVGRYNSAAGRQQRFNEMAKPPLDDNSALELHKSKSYIVSLIDKALSKELGTIPGEKCSRQEFLNMNPKKAIDLVNRHTCPKLCEVHDSMNVATHSAGTRTMRNIDEFCDCKVEPHYMKQLKQLRWSHLKHIQREAKRLADLERFLDSFRESD